MRTSLTTLLTVALAGLLVPVALAVEPTAQNPAKACKAELKADPALFAKTYAPGTGKKKPYATCIATKKAQARALRDATKNAAMWCKAERAKDAAAFTATWGANTNGKNAFGKCVSAKAKELRSAVAEKIESEAKDARVEACKALRKSQPVEFTRAYKNLGRCIEAQPSS